MRNCCCTVYPKKCAHGFVVLCFVVVMQSFIMNSHEVFIHIHQGCFAGTGAIVRLPQCQWNKPDGYGKISQCITTTKHSKAKTVCIFLGIYCMSTSNRCNTNYAWLLRHFYILYPTNHFCISYPTNLFMSHTMLYFIVAWSRSSSSYPNPTVRHREMHHVRLVIRWFYLHPSGYIVVSGVIIWL